MRTIFKSPESFGIAIEEAKLGFVICSCSEQIQTDQEELIAMAKAILAFFNVEHPTPCGDYENKRTHQDA